MKTHLIIILSLVYAGSLTGCAKIRQMTRKDYAVLGDPFLDQSAGTNPAAGQASLAAAAGAGEKDDAGYVKVDLPDVGQPAATASPVQTVSRSRTIVPESTTASLAKITADHMSSISAAPESTKMDMAEMSSFMKQQAEASGLTQTAKDLENDFDAFAAARQKEWHQQVEGIKQKAGGEIQQVVDQASAFGAAAMPSLPDMSFDDGFGIADTAEPLIRQMSGEVSSATARARASVTEIVAEMPNPFVDQVPSRGTALASSLSDNPFGFDEPAINISQPMTATSSPAMTGNSTNGPSAVGNAFDDFAAFADSQLTGKISSQPPAQSSPFVDLNSPVAPTLQQARSQSSFGVQPPANSPNRTLPAASEFGSQNKLDEKFGFDVGWRPANMERR